MTFAIFIVLFLGLFIGVLNVLPTAAILSTTITSSIGVIIGYMKAWDFLFPITELFIAVGVIFTFELTVWFWHVMVKVLHFIRGGNAG